MSDIFSSTLQHLGILTLVLSILLSLPRCLHFALTGGVTVLPPTLHHHRELLYAVEEESPAGTFVGRVPDDSGLANQYTPEVFRSFRFLFLNEPPLALSIDNTTGVIRVSGRVDRESACRGDTGSCRKRLDIAVQPMAYFQIIKATIEILDINDNAPEFRSDSLTLEMLESTAPGLVSAGLSLEGATDRDSPRFAVQRYELVRVNEEGERMGEYRPGGSGKKLDTAGFELKVGKKLDGTIDLKLVSTGPLDRETTSVHYLRLIAYDGGSPPKTGTVSITINVLDVNDNSPVFDKTTYEATVSENVAPLTTVVTMRALDRDIGENGEVRYFFSPTTTTQYGDIFAINNSTGDIYVTGVVDYEINPVYHLMIGARDLGPAPVTAEAMVIVRVDDLNDNSPTVTFNTLSAARTEVASVPEDAPIGAFVAHIIVTDPDSGLNGKSNCSISGAVQSASVRGGGKGDADMVEKFEDYEEMLEAISDNVRGRKSNKSAFRLHRMASAPQESVAEYQVLTTRILDRERHDTYWLDISCQDDGRPSLTSVRRLRVNVSDVNDNTPGFSQAAYTAELLENNYVGALVLQVNATDADTGSNADIVYAIQAETFRRYFEIDSRTGWISARASLDHETNSALRTNVLAVDQGVPQKTGTTQVTVRILDVNDERPIFLAPFYSLGIEENRPAGSEVGMVSAVDADGAPFNRVTYEFQQSGSLSDAFSIDSETGRIVTTRSLDRETHETYHLVAVARDSHAPLTLSGTASVTIVVMDVNDQKPVFLVPPAPENGTVTLSGYTRRGTVVYQVRAVDADAAGENSQILYSMTSSVIQTMTSLFTDQSATSFDVTDMLRINPLQGDVTVSRDLISHPAVTGLDNLTVGLTITATDGGHPTMSSRVFLTVIVDKNLPLPPPPPPAGRYNNGIVDGDDDAASSTFNNYLLFILTLAGASALVLLFLCLAIVFVLRHRRHPSSRHRAPTADDKRHKCGDTEDDDDDDDDPDARLKDAANKYGTLDGEMTKNFVTTELPKFGGSWEEGIDAASGEKKALEDDDDEDNVKMTETSNDDDDDAARRETGGKGTTAGLDIVNFTRRASSGHSSPSGHPPQTTGTVLRTFSYSRPQTGGKNHCSAQTVNNKSSMSNHVDNHISVGGLCHGNGGSCGNGYDAASNTLRTLNNGRVDPAMSHPRHVIFASNGSERQDHIQTLRNKSRDGTPVVYSDGDTATCCHPASGTGLVQCARNHPGPGVELPTGFTALPRDTPPRDVWVTQHRNNVYTKLPQQSPHSQIQSSSGRDGGGYQMMTRSNGTGSLSTTLPAHFSAAKSVLQGHQSALGYRNTPPPSHTSSPVTVLQSSRPSSRGQSPSNPAAQCHSNLRGRGVGGPSRVVQMQGGGSSSMGRDLGGQRGAMTLDVTRHSPLFYGQGPDRQGSDRQGPDRDSFV